MPKSSHRSGAEGQLQDFLRREGHPVCLQCVTLHSDNEILLVVRVDLEAAVATEHQQTAAHRDIPSMSIDGWSSCGWVMTTGASAAATSATQTTTPAAMRHPRGRARRRTTSAASAMTRSIAVLIHQGHHQSRAIT